MREYQAVARWKMRGSKIWYYIFFIIVGGSPIWFLEWFGDTFKIKKGVESTWPWFFLSQTSKSMKITSTIETPMKNRWTATKINDNTKISRTVLTKHCTFYFITQVPPNHSRNHEGLHPTIIKKNVVSNFRSSHFSSSYSPIFTHCDHPQL